MALATSNEFLADGTLQSLMALFMHLRVLDQEVCLLVCSHQTT